MPEWLQPPWLTTAAQHSIPSRNIVPTKWDGHQQRRQRFAVVGLQQQWLTMHWSWTSVPVIEEKWDTITRAQQGDREGKMRRRVSEDFRCPVLSFLSIGSTNASSTGVACVEHSSEVLRHEAPVNVRVLLTWSPFYFKVPLLKYHVLIRG